MSFAIFQSGYTDADGKRHDGAAYHIRFRDHQHRRQTLAAGPLRKTADKWAELLQDLVHCRRTGERPDERLQRWLDGLPPHVRKRLIRMELIDPRTAAAETPLLEQLDGRKGADGKIIDPGYLQVLESKEVTAGHVRTVTGRIRRILQECNLFFWSDLLAPGAETRIEVFLGGLRAKGSINGTTVNYFVRDFRTFCRWLAKKTRAAAMPMLELRGVDNAQQDSEVRRALSVDELRWLLSVCEQPDAPVVCGLSGAQRKMLYRFCFETGLRPRQVRELRVKHFELKPAEGDAPTVRSVARYVKRRRPHVQVLRPELAAELQEHFQTHMRDEKGFLNHDWLDAPAFRCPSQYHAARMLRVDLASARRQWLDEAGDDHEERDRRKRSDFLLDVNHQGERAVFYSIRHGHGTALASAGVPERDIAQSMHHASRQTTARYLHTDQASKQAAIAALPNLATSPRKQLATGTDGATPRRASRRSPAAPSP